MRQFFIVNILIIFAISCFFSLHTVGVQQSAFADEQYKTLTINYDGEFFFERTYKLNLATEHSLIEYLNNNANNADSYLDVVYRMSNQLAQDLQILAKRYTYAPTESKIVADEKGIKVTRHKTGNYVELDALILAAVSGMDRQTAVELPCTTIMPNVTKELNLGKVSLMGEYSTSYESSKEGRKHNIHLASQTLNFTVIKPNEQFSFNQKVGRRSEERGYQKAPIIVGGEFKEGFGGGVCQVSTTLYNAVMLSGLKVISYSPHSMLVGYIAPSRDAMVSSVSDFVFENNTNSNVYVYTKNQDNVLTFSIYGEKQPYEYRMRSQTISQTTSEEGFNVLYSKAYLGKYIDNELISESLLREDWYRLYK